MIGTVTYTGVTGPAVTLTAAVFTNVHKLTFDYDKETVTIEWDNPSKTSVVDLRASTTITSVVVAGQTVSTTIS